MPTWKLGAGVLAAAAVAGAAAAQTPAGLTLAGLGGRGASVSLAEVAALPRATVHVVQHDQPHDFSGPLALDLLARVGAPHGEALRGRALGYVVVARGRDGYVAALALAECDPAIRPAERVIVADREDGRPLPAAEGPLRLVIEGDARPARAVRMLAGLSLVDLGAR
ncbi:MAG: molybdopterin-binding oxidoreductase [Caulobacteraceae bacterium]|nr:molybdopterin-binding oxidoreductase [Caulobacter sp.]